MKTYLSYGAIAASFVAGCYFTSLYYDSAELAETKRQQAIDERLDFAVKEIARQTTESLSKIRIENKTIVNEVQREILKEPVYSECMLTADGLLMANKARLAD